MAYSVSDKEKDRLEKEINTLLSHSSPIPRGDPRNKLDGAETSMRTSTPAGVRREALSNKSEMDRRYNMEGYPTDKAGQPKIVTSEVCSIIDFGTAQIVKRLANFTELGRFVPCADVMEEDLGLLQEEGGAETLSAKREQEAEDATRLISYLLNKDGTFEPETYKWTKDGLMDPASIMKVYYDPNTVSVDMKAEVVGKQGLRLLSSKQSVVVDDIKIKGDEKSIKMEDALNAPLPDDPDAPPVIYEVEYTKTT